MKIKELSNTVLEMIRRGDKDNLITLISDNVGTDEQLIKVLSDIQIQLKEIGGGYPPVGKQIETIDEIIEFTEIAVKIALDNENKLAAGILYHNQASFCFPNMDDGVDTRLIKPGYFAAVKDYEIRQEIGKKGPMLWAKWLVGISEFIRGDTVKALEILEETAKLANEEPIEKDIDTWARMMIAKFYLRSIPEKRDLAFEMLQEVNEEFTALMDSYGLQTVASIINTYF
ncbi:MAG: hypothetical protein KGD64_06390 [Candidatus Heimdallarchaeota archaeon]|nr:hypothetical protein [Candidatus Heimdallarchaeota archaeon]